MAPDVLIGRLLFSSSWPKGGDDERIQPIKLSGELDSLVLNTYIILVYMTNIRQA